MVDVDIKIYLKTILYKRNVLFTCYIDREDENEGKKEILDFAFYLVCCKFTHYPCELMTQAEFFEDFGFDEYGPDVEFYNALCFTDVTLDSKFVDAMKLLLHMFTLLVSNSIPFKKVKKIDKWKWEEDLGFGNHKEIIYANCLEINEAVCVTFTFEKEEEEDEIFSPELLNFLKRNTNIDSDTSIGSYIFDFYKNVYHAVMENKIKKTTGGSYLGTSSTAAANYRFIEKIKVILKEIIDDDSETILQKSKNFFVKLCEETIMCTQIVCLIQSYYLYKYKEKKNKKLEERIGTLLSDLAVPSSTLYDYTEVVKIYGRKIAKIADYFQDNLTKETVWVSDAKRKRIINDLMFRVMKNVKETNSK